MTVSGEREYPREWFEVSRFGGKPNPKTFVRETASMLFYMDCGEERRDKKETSYSKWYPTLEEAQAACDRRRARDAQKATESRIRYAAPDLYKALAGIIPHLWVPEDDEAFAAAVEAARAAIAKARGEQPA